MLSAFSIHSMSSLGHFAFYFASCKSQKQGEESHSTVKNLNILKTGNCQLSGKAQDGKTAVTDKKMGSDLFLVKSKVE